MRLVRPWMRRNSNTIGFKEVSGNNNENQTLIQQSESNSDNNDKMAVLEDKIKNHSDYHRHGKTVGIPKFIIKATAIASLGGILFGYDLGVVSGALPQLTNTFQLTERQQEMVVSILYLGGGLGAALGGSICDKFGRRSTILMTDVWFICGALILFVSKSVSVVMLGRVVVGFAVAVSGIADVSYLHEIAPSEWRGSIVSVNEACISLGFLLAYVAGFLIDNVNPNEGWRHMFGLSAVVAFLQLVGMYYMPESPVWLKEVGRLQQCQESLRTIHGGDGDDDIFDDKAIHKESDNNTQILGTQEKEKPTAKTTLVARRSSDNLIKISKQSPPYEALNTDPNRRNLVEEEEEEAGDIIGQKELNFLQNCYVTSLSSFHKFYTVINRYYRQCYIALFLAITQQLCGQTSVLNYAPIIFSSITGSSSSSEEEHGQSMLGSTLLIGVVKFIVTIFVIWKIEYLGRRFLLLVGMSIITIGMLLLVIAFSGSGSTLQSSNGEVDSSEEEVNGLTTSSTNLAFFLALPGVLLVVLGYSMSFGPLTWLLTSELFPTDIRGRALGASTIVTYLCASFVTFTFLSGTSTYGSRAVFAMYASISAMGLLWAFLAIPDTGGKQVSDIEHEICTMWFWRDKSLHISKEVNKTNVVIDNKKQQELIRRVELV